MSETGQVKVPSLETVLESLRDLREASTDAYKAGRIEAEPFVRAGNVLSGDHSDPKDKIIADLLEAAHGVDVLYAEMHSAMPRLVGKPGYDIVVAAVQQARAAIAAAKVGQ